MISFHGCKKRFFILIGIFLFILMTPAAKAEPLTLLAKSRYFSIYGPPRLDILRVLSILNMDYTHHLQGVMEDTQGDLYKILEKTIDAVYLEVSDILGIILRRYHGTIRIYPYQRMMQDDLRRLFGVRLTAPSYYYFENNTIYVSLEEMTLGMFAHEVAHAIISRYFVVPPPPKIQEVLSGYVEFKFKK